jgi:hypothetical protein
MSRRRASGAVITLAALAGCQAGETAEQMHARMQVESDSAKVAIEAQGARFAAAFNARQADSAAMVYTMDAVVMPPTNPRSADAMPFAPG